MIKNLQIKRNRTIYQDKNNAINALNNIKNDLKDGEIVLSRYYVNGNIETLIGVKTINGNTHNINYLDSFADLSGSEIQASTTKITSDIPVVGGPLADLVHDKIQTITAGTDIQALLFDLFCEELYPTNYKSQKGNVTARINAPTLILKTSASTLTNNISLEVGTKVSATTISFNDNSIANMTASTVTGMIYGYSNNDDNDKDSSDDSISKIPTTAHNTTSVAKLVCTINSGFVSGTGFTLSGNVVTSLTETNRSLGVIDDGTNKITVSVTGQPISYSISGISSVYPCSNLGNTDSNYKTNAVDSVSLTATTAPTASNTFTITGVRYGFHGKVGEDTNITSVVIRSLTKITASTITEITASGDGVKKYIVAIPQKWIKKITYVKDNSNQYDITNSYRLSSTSVSVTDASGGKATAYDIYIYTSDIADNINHKITLGNK
jgi:hypothetical protein